MEEEENLTKIEEEIKNLKKQKTELKRKIELKKSKENKGLRLKSDNNGKSNKLTRVSRHFINKLDFINNKREENGFEKLSYPKITQLIIKHKTSWVPIQNDIILFNNKLNKELQC